MKFWFIIWNVLEKLKFFEAFLQRKLKENLYETGFNLFLSPFIIYIFAYNIGGGPPGVAGQLASIIYILKFGMSSRKSLLSFTNWVVYT